MGMSASQAHLMSLTARLSDLEFKAQHISRSRIDLATSSDKASQEYVNSMDVKKLSLKVGYNGSDIKYQDLTYNKLTGPEMVGMFASYQYTLSDNYGRALVTQKIANSIIDPATSAEVDIDTFRANNGVTSSSDANYQYYTNLYERMKGGQYVTVADEKNTLDSPEWIYDRLRNGDLFLDACKFENNEYKWGTTSWQTSTDIIEEDDDRGEAVMKAQYETRLSKIKEEDKQLELDLKQIDTEHTAVQSEIDTVRKVIDKNEERSFKTFG